MATTIITKNGTGAPLASDLVAGELAVDLTNKRLYTEDSGGTIIEVGTNPSGAVTFNSNATFSGTAEAQFRDSALKVSSSVDGQLDIDADVELEITAPTVDIDASTAVTIDTATLTVTGAANVTGDLDVDNININGNAIISTDTNGNIDLTPNGTGEVNISKVDIDAGAIDGTAIGANSASTGAFTTLTASTSLNIASSTTVDGVLDEDTMSSNSATKLATQQSIKAYVDSQVGANNELSEVLANGNTTGSTNIVVTAGQSITTDSILETTAAAGVDIDGVLLKDTSVGTDDASGTDVAGTAVTVKGGAGTGTGAGGSLVFQTAPAGSTGSSVNAQVTALTIDSAGDATFAGDVNVTGALNLTGAIDVTDLEVTNIKAKDGTASASIADSTGVITIASSVLTTTDINGGSIDGTTIGASTAAAITGTTITATDDVTLTGASYNVVWDSSDNALEFADNAKAVFGAGSDLYIYHDGSDSFITENGTGDLKISGEAQIKLGSVAGEFYATFNNNSSVALYYDNALKLETTTSGIDVTGTIVGDGLTLDGGATIQSATGGVLTLKTTDTAGAIGEDVGSIDFYNSDISTGSTGVQARILGEQDSAGDSTALQFFTGYSTGSGSPTLQKRLEISGASGTQGDISFYEDTGTTAKFFWDASAESLGIGTSSPSTLLHVKSTGSATATIEAEGGGDAILDLKAAEASGGESIIRFSDSVSGVGFITYAQNDGGSDFMRFGTASTERMRIDSSGNVGIGTSSPSYSLDVDEVGTNSTGTFLLTGGNSASNDYTQTALLKLRGTSINPNQPAHDANSSVAEIRLNHTDLAGNASSGNITFYTNPSNNVNGSLAERMRIDSSGNVGIGNSSPDSVLTAVNAASTAALRIGLNNTSFNYMDADNNIFRSGAGTEHMRIGSDGAVTLKPTGITTGLRLQGRSSDNNFFILFNNNTGATNYASIGTNSGLSALYYSSENHIFTNTSSANEYMRIDSNGNLLVGTTDSSGTAGSGIKLSNPTSPADDGKIMVVGASSTSAQDGYQLYSTGASAYRFYVTYGGAIYATSTSITAISDESLKENIRDLDKGLDTIKALKPRRFDWKNGDGNDIMGFVAQEVQEVLPELVHDYKLNETETKLGLKMGDMIPSLVKAIQEQQDLIESLTARIAALEGAN